eukprot:snap_masked-scaffold_4-processed-gene-21.17-mRNA-1 protein AED:1.00 eAED:1.00 QI:0/-1/0/0/-1/1/1/0/80
MGYRLQGTQEKQHWSSVTRSENILPTYECIRINIKTTRIYGVTQEKGVTHQGEKEIKGIAEKFPEARNILEPVATIAEMI